MKKQQGFSVLVIVLLLLLLALIGFGAYYVSTRDTDPAETTSEATSEATDSTPTEETTDEPAESPEPEPTSIENEDFSLTLPEGFSESDTRQFTFTGQPERTYTFVNASTGDYFEVNVTPADSGINADFVWTYTYDGSAFTLDKSDSTVCLPEEDEWCEFSGANDRLDAAIFAQPEAPIDGKRIYFTFGNTNSQTVGDLTFVDDFLAAISF